MCIVPTLVYNAELLCYGWRRDRKRGDVVDGWKFSKIQDTIISCNSSHYVDVGGAVGCLMLCVSEVWCFSGLHCQGVCVVVRNNVEFQLLSDRDVYSVSSLSMAKLSPGDKNNIHQYIAMTTVQFSLNYWPCVQFSIVDHLIALHVCVCVCLRHFQWLFRWDVHVE